MNIKYIIIFTASLFRSGPALALPVGDLKIHVGGGAGSSGLAVTATSGFSVGVAWRHTLGLTGLSLGPRLEAGYSSQQVRGPEDDLTKVLAHYEHRTVLGGVSLAWHPASFSAGQEFYVSMTRGRGLSRLQSSQSTTRSFESSDFSGIGVVQTVVESGLVLRLKDPWHLSLGLRADQQRLDQSRVWGSFEARRAVRRGYTLQRGSEWGRGSIDSKGELRTYAVTVGLAL